MFTRADYMATAYQTGRAGFERYYREIIEACGGAAHLPPPVPLDDVRAALAAGDEHHQAG